MLDELEALEIFMETDGEILQEIRWVLKDTVGMATTVGTGDD